MPDIKKITAFSEDAIEQCMTRVFKPEEKEIYVKLSKTLLEGLEACKKPAVKRKLNTGKATLPSAEEVFNDKILPQIKNKLEVYEKDLVNGLSHTLTTNLSEFHKDYSKLSLQELLQADENILKQERTIGAMNLIVKFYRGMLYMTFYNQALSENPPTLEQWFQKNLNINYDTAMRYITFACLIRRFPRLIVCELSFEQLLKHREILKKHLTIDDDLNAKLSIATEFGYLSNQSTKRLNFIF